MQIETCFPGVASAPRHTKIIALGHGKLECVLAFLNPEPAASFVQHSGNGVLHCGLQHIAGLISFKQCLVFF
jgi:hypothetical protein